MIGRKKKTKGEKSAAGGSPKSRIVKKLMLETTVIIVVVGGLFGASTFLSDIEEKEKQKRDQIETEALQLTGKLQTLRSQMSEYAYALPLSQKLLDSEGASTLNLSRDTAFELFLKLKEKHHLEDVKVTISAIETPEKENSGKQHIETTFSMINVQMTAYTDQQVYSYINEVVDELPGVVDIESLQMMRGNAYTFQDQAGRDDESFNRPQVKTKIMFKWHGLKSKKKDNNTAGGNA